MSVLRRLSILITEDQLICQLYKAGAKCDAEGRYMGIWREMDDTNHSRDVTT